MHSFIKQPNVLDPQFLPKKKSRSVTKKEGEVFSTEFSYVALSPMSAVLTSLVLTDRKKTVHF